MNPKENPARPPSRHPVRSLRAAAWLALLPAGTVDRVPAAEVPASAPALSVDASAPGRDERLPGSFAPVVRRVAPAVVGVFTTRPARAGWPGRPGAPEAWGSRWPLPDSGGERSSVVRPSGRARWLGSGVVVTPDGYILTRHHVVEGEEVVRVSFQEDRPPQEARVIGKDPQVDLAVLKVDASGLPALTVADSDQVAVGDVVLAVGNPFGAGPSVSHGIVSGVHRGIPGPGSREEFLRTDAPLDPGHSGGALVDVQGRLVGLTTAGAPRGGSGSGMGLALPSNRARRAMEALLREGGGQRGTLGLVIQDLTAALAREFGAPEARGALVSGVRPDGPAAKAGVQRGDVIVGIGGDRVEDSGDLRDRLSGLEPGRTVELRVLREGKPESVRVALGEAASEERGRGPGDEVLRGVVVADLTVETRGERSIPEEVQGALVTGVPEDSAAHAAGLREGDVLMEVNRQAVPDVQAALEATRHVPDRRVLLRVWGPGGERYLVVDEGKAP